MVEGVTGLGVAVATAGLVLKSDAFEVSFAAGPGVVLRRPPTPSREIPVLARDRQPTS